MSGSPGTRKDPLTTFLFGLALNGDGITMDPGTAFFKSVSGLKSETEVVDYSEGGVNEFTRKFQGVTKWPNLVLKQGFTGDLTLFYWKQSLVRTNGSIFILGPNLQKVAEWRFKRGWPVKWEGPDLDASKNELAIETIEIAHEGLEALAASGTLTG
jgi:phage tail-like protein